MGVLNNYVAFQVLLGDVVHCTGEGKTTQPSPKKSHRKSVSLSGLSSGDKLLRVQASLLELGILKVGPEEKLVLHTGSRTNRGWLLTNDRLLQVGRCSIPLLPSAHDMMFLSFSALKASVHLWRLSPWAWHVVNDLIVCIFQVKDGRVQEDIPNAAIKSAVSHKVVNYMWGKG